MQLGALRKRREAQGVTERNQRITAAVQHEDGTIERAQGGPALETIDQQPTR